MTKPAIHLSMPSYFPARSKEQIENRTELNETGRYVSYNRLAVIRMNNIYVLFNQLSLSGKEAPHEVFSEAAW